VRRIVAEAREKIESGTPGATASDEAGWLTAAAGRADGLVQIRPRAVINATGVVLHTNLGRAPLAEGAAEAALRAAVGYSDLELDIASGRRGDRLAGIAEKLCLLTGAEAAYACNNNAAAVLLALNSLAAGREVIVSRGELVEIGGSFRIPEIMERAGVRLVEVGSTNRTHARDYERAIGPQTALLLKVHRSNFEQRGFVKEVELAELSAIARAAGLPVLEDLGSGTVVDLRSRGLPVESYAPARLRGGADLVCFSGDKLLGGPQAGLLLGRTRHVSALRSNPLARALRLDKMTLAALDWTLACALGGRAEEEIPVLRQLLVPAAELEARTRELASRLAAFAAGGLDAQVLPDRVPVGGGSLPGFELEGWVLVLRHPEGAERLSARLRMAAEPVVSRVRDDAVLIDLRTVPEASMSRLEKSIAEALR
jgi:L-seryl-tRNA(Ser) seleniumtransferase